MPLYDYDFDYSLCEDRRDPEIDRLEKRLESAQEFTIALYEELTSDKPIDLWKVQNCLSELSGYMDFDESQFGPLTIERKAS